MLKAPCPRSKACLGFPTAVLSLLPLRFNAQPWQHGATPHAGSCSRLPRPALAACQRPSLSRQCPKPLISPPLPRYLFGPLLDAEAPQGRTSHPSSEPAQVSIVRSLPPPHHRHLLPWLPRLPATPRSHAERVHPHLLAATQPCLSHRQSPACPPPPPARQYSRRCCRTGTASALPGSTCLRSWACETRDETGEAA